MSPGGSDSRTALITGVTGQDGIYLARLLADAGAHVVGTVRPGSSAGPRVGAYLTDVTVVELDIRDSAGLAKLLAVPNSPQPDPPVIPDDQALAVRSEPHSGV